MNIRLFPISLPALSDLKENIKFHAFFCFFFLFLFMEHQVKASRFSKINSAQNQLCGKKHYYILIVNKGIIKGISNRKLFFFLGTVFYKNFFVKFSITFDSTQYFLPFFRIKFLASCFCF